MTNRTRAPLLSLLIFACGSTPSAPPPAQAPEPAPVTSDDRVPPPPTAGADRLTYRFQDASVPPPHHRSQTIEATPARILRVVDSYGDEIERQEASITPDQFRALLEVVERSVARRATPTDNPGCTGGTGESVDLGKGGEGLFRASVYHCGGSHTGDLVGDPAALRDAMLALFPGQGVSP